MKQFKLWVSRSGWILLVMLVLSQPGCLTVPDLPDRQADLATIMPVDTELPFGHWGSASAIRLASSGRHVVTTGSSDATMQIKRWDWHTRGVVTTPCGPVGGFISSALSADGRYVAVQQASPGGTHVWDSATATEVGVLPPWPGNGVLMAVSPAGDRLLFLGEEGFTVWDVASGECLSRWERDSNYSIISNEIVFMPDSQFVVMGIHEYIVYDQPWWDINTYAPMQNWFVSVVDVTTGREVRRIDVAPDDRRILAMVVDPTGQWALTARRDGTIASWSLASGDRAYGMTVAGRHLPIALSRTGRYAVTMDEYGMPSVWDLAEVERLLSRQPPAGVTPGNTWLDYFSIVGTDTYAVPWLIDISDDGSMLALTDGGAVEVWDVAPDESLADLPADPRVADAMAVSSDGQVAYIARPDGRAYFLDTTTGQWRRAQDIDFTVTAAVMLGNNQAIVGGAGGELEITGPFITPDQSPTYFTATLSEADGVAITALVASNCERYLATGDADGRVRLWDLEDLSIRWERHLGQAVRSLDFAREQAPWEIDETSEPPSWADHRPDVLPPGLLAAQSVDRVVVWDMIHGVPQAVLSDEGFGEGITFSDDATRLYTIWGGVVSEWDWARGEETAAYADMDGWLWSGAVSAMAIGPDERLYVVGRGGSFGIGRELRVGVFDLFEQRGVLAARGVRRLPDGYEDWQEDVPCLSDFGLPLCVSPSGVVVEVGRYGVVNIWRLGEAESLAQAR